MFEAGPALPTPRTCGNASLSRKDIEQANTEVMHTLVESGVLPYPFWCLAVILASRCGSCLAASIQLSTPLPWYARPASVYRLSHALKTVKSPNLNFANIKLQPFWAISPHFPAIRYSIPTRLKYRTQSLLGSIILTVQLLVKLY